MVDQPAPSPIKLPINEASYKNTDPESLDQFSEVLMDGFLETIPDRNIKVSRMRPGLGAPIVTLGTGKPVDALYWWNGRKIALAVSNGLVFKIEKSGSTYTKTQLTGSILNKSNRVIFDELGSTLAGFKVVMAAGEKIYYSEDAIAVQAMAHADAPNPVSHVAVMDGYVIANKIGTKEFWWNDPTYFTIWYATYFASKEGRPDDLMAVVVAQRELFLIGEETVEMWYNDGVSPFARTTIAEFGAASKYSICRDGGDLYFLNNQKKVIVMQNGRNPTVISEAYDQFIQTKITTITDMYSYIMNIEGKKFYVMQFPTDNRTLVYDIKENAWYEWGKWQNEVIETLAYNRFLGSCYAQCPQWGANLVGSRLDDNIYDISMDNYDDDGDKIRFLKRTGNISHGTMLSKRASELVFTAKSGVGKADKTAAHFTFRFRDNGRKIWSNERMVSLGALGEYEIRKKFTRLGMYQVRQFEFTYSDLAPFTLIEAEEVVEILGR